MSSASRKTNDSSFANVYLNCKNQTAVLQVQNLHFSGRRGRRPLPKSVFKNKKCPNFALGQMMILSETRNFNLHLFGITY